MEREAAIGFLSRFFTGFSESSLYEDYRDYEGVTDEQYEAAWAALRTLPAPAAGQLTGKESPFANDPIVIAISDKRWTGVLVDAYDNDPVYYEHHQAAGEHDGFVERGDHYVIIFVTKQGEVNIDMGYHRHEIPAHAYVIEG